MRIALATTSGLPAMDQDEPQLVAALTARGVPTEVVDWDDRRADWSAHDAVVIRSTWDYTARLDEFLAWARRVEASGTRLFNDAEVVRWNSHKRYLIELEERGAPIVPTAWLARGDDVSLAEVADARGWSGVVAKPAIGAGAVGLLVVPPGTDPSASQGAFDALLVAGDTMVQPFVPSIAEGELSVVVIDGRASHAVRKLPAGDGVRTQIEFGGRYVPERVDDEAGRLAEWVVEATGADLLYARVDLLADDDGSWMLGELELIEPALLLAWSDGGADRLADALLARLG